MIKTKKLVADVDAITHSKIKILASVRGETMGDFLRSAVDRELRARGIDTLTIEQIAGVSS